MTGTTIHVVHEAGCRDTAICAEIPIQTAHLHDQHLYPVELRLGAEYAINSTLGLEAQVPLRSVTTRIQYTTLTGAAYEPLDPGVHHRDETVTGMGDPWILFRLGGTLEKWWFASRLGLALPLGRTEENPFELGDQGLRHQHIQLGSGTFVPIAVAEAFRAFEPLELQFFAQVQFPFYENRHGYRAPFRIYGGTALGTQLLHQLKGFLGVEAFHEAAEAWDGQQRQDGNLGRSELLGAATLSQTFGATELTLAVRVPVWRKIIVGDEPSGELSSPLTLSLALTHTFGG